MDFPWDNSSEERPSFDRNFQQQLEQKLQLQNDLAGKMQLQEGPESSWKRDFGASLFSDSSNQIGAFKSFPSSGSMFNYSQKNFHTSNGNLYSIFSPFQSRKSITKPSFLRGHVTSNETGLRDASPLSIETGTGTGTGMFSAGGSGSGLRKSRSKLKFHHQNVPPQYRKNLKESDTCSNFNSYKSYSHHRSSASSFVKSQSIFSENKKQQFFEDNDSLSMDELFKDKETKKDDPFAAIDLSSTSDKLFEKDFDSEKRANRLRKSRACRSFFEDSDDEDIEPLNLCIADQLKESKLSFIKSTNDKVRKMQRNFFANRSPQTSVFRSPTIDFNQEYPEKNILKSDRSRKEKDDEAMDLSFNTDGKTKERSANISSRSASTGSIHKEKEKKKKVPHISEMLENMSIWDDHSRSPNPPRDHLSANGDVWSQQLSPNWGEKSASGREISKVQDKICTASKNDNTEEVKLVTGSVPTNYYVFIPSPYIQVFDQKEAVATTSTNSATTTPTGDPEKLIIYVPSENKSSKTSSNTVKPVKSVKESVNLKEKFNQQTDDNVNICKFKLVKGQQPSLEEKKNFFVPLPRSSKRPLEEQESMRFGKSSESGTKADHFRTYKIHVGLQDEMGRKLSSPRKIRRRSRKALARDKLEATFREQGFLIKTQQVSSAEGSVYCKFRQLKKFTRYLFKSWRNYLPKDLEQMSANKEGGKPAVTLSMPDIPGAYKQMYSIPTARSASATFDSASLTANVGETPGNENGNKLMVSNSMPLICHATNASESLSASVSPCPSTCSLTHTLSSSSVP